MLSIRKIVARYKQAQQKLGNSPAEWMPPMPDFAISIENFDKLTRYLAELKERLTNAERHAHYREICHNMWYKDHNDQGHRIAREKAEFAVTKHQDFLAKYQAIWNELFSTLTPEQQTIILVQRETQPSEEISIDRYTAEEIREQKRLTRKEISELKRKMELENLSLATEIMTENAHDKLHIRYELYSLCDETLFGRVLTVAIIVDEDGIFKRFKDLKFNIETFREDFKNTMRIYLNNRVQRLKYIKTIIEDPQTTPERRDRYRYALAVAEGKKFSLHETYVSQHVERFFTITQYILNCNYTANLADTAIQQFIVDVLLMEPFEYSIELRRRVSAGLHGVRSRGFITDVEYSYVVSLMNYRVSSWILLTDELKSELTKIGEIQATNELVTGVANSFLAAFDIPMSKFY